MVKCWPALLLFEPIFKQISEHGSAAGGVWAFWASDWGSKCTGACSLGLGSGAWTGLHLRKGVCHGLLSNAVVREDPSNTLNFSGRVWDGLGFIVLDFTNPRWS